MEMLLTVAAGLYIAWMLAGMFFTTGKIKISGNVYGRKVSLGVLVALFAVYIALNRDNLWQYWYTYTAIGIALLLYFLMRSGLGESGLYFNGRFIPYTNIKSYAIDQVEERKFSLRLEAKLKDYVLEFHRGKKVQVETAMKETKLPVSKVRRS